MCMQDVMIARQYESVTGRVTSDTGGPVRVLTGDAARYRLIVSGFEWASPDASLSISIGPMKNGIMFPLAIVTPFETLKMIRYEDVGPLLAGDLWVFTTDATNPILTYVVLRWTKEDKDILT